MLYAYITPAQADVKYLQKHVPTRLAGGTDTPWGQEVIPPADREIGGSGP